MRVLWQRFYNRVLTEDELSRMHFRARARWWFARPRP